MASNNWFTASDGGYSRRVASYSERRKQDEQDALYAQQELEKFNALRAGGKQNPDGSITPKKPSFLDYLNPIGEYGLFGKRNAAQVAHTAGQMGDWTRKKIDEAIGEEGNDKFDSANDVTRFAANLLPGMVEGLLQSGKNFHEAASGKRLELDDNGEWTGGEEDLSGVQRLAAGTIGTLDTVGIGLGGTGKFVKEIFKKPLDSALKTAAKKGLASEVKDTAKRMGVEGLEESLSSVAEDLQDDSQLSEDWLANAGKGFALGVAGGGMFDVSGRVIGATKNAAKTAKANKQTNTPVESSTATNAPTQSTVTKEQAERLVRIDTQLNERIGYINEQIKALQEGTDPSVRRVVASDGTDVTAVVEKYNNDIKNLETQIRDLQQQADGIDLNTGKADMPEAAMAEIEADADSTPKKHNRPSYDIENSPQFGQFVEEARKAKSFEEFANGVYEVPIESLHGNTPEAANTPGLSRTPNEPVEMYMRQGRPVIDVTDGNHRLYEAKARGDKTIKARFNDATKADNAVWGRLRDFYDEVNASEPEVENSTADPSEYTGDVEGRAKAAERIPELRQKIEDLRAEQAEKFEMLGGVSDTIDTDLAKTKMRELKSEKAQALDWKLRNNIGETASSIKQKIDDIDNGVISDELVEVREQVDSVEAAVRMAEETDPSDISQIQRAAVINQIHREAANNKMGELWTQEKADKFESEYDANYHERAAEIKEMPGPKQQAEMEALDAEYIEVMEGNAARVQADMDEVVAVEQALKIADDIDARIVERANDILESNPTAFGRVDDAAVAEVRTGLEIAHTLKKQTTRSPEQMDRIKKQKSILDKQPKGKATPSAGFVGNEYVYEETTTGTGDQNADFFTEKAGIPSSNVKYNRDDSLVKNVRSKTVAAYDKYAAQGNFTGHISKMIPGFQERQISVADAIAKSGAKNFLDIGASEGGLAKTVSSVNPKVHSIALDPNSQMNENNASTGKVKNAVADKRAFGDGYTEDDGTVVEGFRTDKKFDVINEDFTFQFISNNRAEQVAEVANLLSDDGVFITNEKFHTFNREFHEQKKYEHQEKYFDQDALTEDKQTIVSGMDRDMVSDTAYEAVLKENFDIVVQYWDSGNFKGYLAGNDATKINKMIEDIGDTGDKFAEYSGPKLIKDTTGNIKYDQEFYNARNELAALEQETPQGMNNISQMESEDAVKLSVRNAADVDEATTIINEDPRLSEEASVIIADQVQAGNLKGGFRDHTITTMRDGLLKMTNGDKVVAELDGAIMASSRSNNRMTQQAKADKWKLAWKDGEATDQSIAYWDKGEPITRMKGESQSRFEQRQTAVDSVKSWLRDKAEEQGLSPEQMITHYFPHNFQQQFGKGFDATAEAIARLESGINKNGKKLTDKQRNMLERQLEGVDLGTRQMIESAKIYKVGKNGHLEKRQGAEGWSKDIPFVLDMYERMSNQSTHMQPALDNIKAMTTDLRGTQLHFLEDALDAVTGKKTRGDEKLGSRGVKVISTSRRLSNVALMGASARTVALQPFSIINNWREAPNSRQFIMSTLQSMRALKPSNAVRTDPIVREFLEAGGMEGSFSVSLKSGKMTKIERGMMGGIALVDRTMRLGAYDMGKADYAKKLGKDLDSLTPAEYDAAKAAGVAMARKAQFGVGPMDIPLAQSSEVGKMIFQLQQFNMKQLGQEVRYIVGDKDGSLVKIQKNSDGKIVSAKFTAKGAKNLVKTLAGYSAMYALYTQIAMPGDEEGDSKNPFGLDVQDILPFGEQIGAILEFATTGEIKDEVQMPIPPVISALVGRGGSDKGVVGHLYAALTGGEDTDTDSELAGAMKSAIRNFLPGGTQGVRTFEGAKAVLQGESKNLSGSTRFLVDNESGWNIIKGLVAGQYATTEGQEWLRNGMNTINKNATVELSDGSKMPVSEYVRTVIRDPEEKAAWIGYYATKQNAEKQLKDNGMSRSDKIREVRLRLTSGQISQGQATAEIERYNDTVRELYRPYYETVEKFPPRLANDFLEGVLINPNGTKTVSYRQMDEEKFNTLSEWEEYESQGYEW